MKKSIISILLAVGLLVLPACEGGDLSSFLPGTGLQSGAQSSSSGGSSEGNSSSSSSDENSDASSSSSGGEDSSGDGSSDSSSDSEDVFQGVSEYVYDGSEVTITLQHYMGRTLVDTVEKNLSRFNEQYPDIHVALVSSGNAGALKDNVLAGMGNGNEEDIPSLAICFPEQLVSYQKTGGLVPLDEYMNNGEKVASSQERVGFTSAQLDDFFPSFLSEGILADGKNYALPLYTSSEVLYYNKTFFENNGLKVPTTWEEMEEVCAQIKEIDGNSIPLGYDSESNWFINMAKQLGSEYTSDRAGENFLFDNEKNRAFVEKLKEWYEKGYCTTRELCGGYTSNLFNETSVDGQKCYMSIASSGGAAYQAPEQTPAGKDPFEVGVAMLPQVDVNAPKVIQNTQSICLFKKENPQENAAAWLLMKYLSTDATLQAELSLRMGYTPVIKSVQGNESFQEYLTESAAGGNRYLTGKVITQTLAQADAYYTLPKFEGAEEARSAVGALLTECLCGQTTSQTAAQMIKEKFVACVGKLCVNHSQAIPVTLRELCENLAFYEGKRVGVTATVTAVPAMSTVYLVDGEGAELYGLPAFYGFNLSFNSLLTAGNRVYVTGELSYGEIWGYQLVDLKYDALNPDDISNVRVLETGVQIPYVERTVQELSANDYALAKQSLYTPVAIKGLRVVKTYTTTAGDSAGAMTLTCEDSQGNQMVIRTNVLYDESQKIITAEAYAGKTIDVLGHIAEYNGTYQIKVVAAKDITVQK